MKLKSRKFPKVWNSAIRGRGGGRHPGILNHHLSQNIRQAKGTRLKRAKMKPLKCKIYVYLFNHVPSGWRLQGVNAYHGIDVAYDFGYQAGISFFYNILFFPPASVSVDSGLDVKDDYVAEATMKMWA
jgi:hypothetical protein